MKRRIKFQGILMLLAFLTTVVLYKTIFPRIIEEHLDELNDTLGIVLILFGFLFRIIARGYKAEVSSGGNKLINTGLYRIIRNPMYFGSFLIGVGVVLSVFVWWVFFIFLVIFLFIYTIQTRKEEKELLSRFGDEYKRYCQATPKYFPRFSDLFSQETKNHIFLRPQWIKKELASLLTVMFMLLIVEVWQDAKLYGHSELFKEPLEIFSTIFIVIMIMFLFLRNKKVIIIEK